jgi:hypothetical protein
LRIKEQETHIILHEHDDDDDDDEISSLSVYQLITGLMRIFQLDISVVCTERYTMFCNDVRLCEKKKTHIAFRVEVCDT